MGQVQSSDGTAIAYERSGDGPALVIVGGAFADAATAAPLAAVLAPRFTVYAYDRRGRGASGDTPPYAVDREIEDLQAVIEEAGGSAFVYGHSSGAALALETAARGSGVAKLALYEPPYVVNGTGPRRPADLTRRLAELAAADRRGDAVELFMKEGPGVPDHLIAQMRRSPVWAGLENLAHTLHYDTTIMGDGSVPTERAAAVAAPTLVMDGGESPGWARASAEALAAALPDARHRRFEDQDHGVAHDVIGPVLKRFFR
jgi:pimeloyl-ACP methyl ester carboxylesterase